MPFICLRRADIPNSTLQVTDLWPNKSQYNPSYGPAPQGPRYVNGPQSNTPVLTSTGGDQRQFAAACAGLSAYLLANVAADPGGANIALTPTQADTCAAAIIARVRAGNTVTLANINTILVANVAAATELTSAGGSTSTGALTDVLRILAGATYTVPVGTVVQTALTAFNAQGTPAVWNSNNFNFNTYKDVLAMDSSFYKSLAEGQINGFTLSSFSYRGSAGAGLVVYDDTGNVL
jgi:antitoxin (DNA-binding transcriptional repressor) of toxin-antitoxin stability system